MKYVHRHFDHRRPGLFLPDGRLAASLRRNPLWAELAKLNIPEIDSKMGKDDLLSAYEARVREIAQSLPRTEAPTDSRGPKEIPETAMRRAAEIIAEQASAPPAGHAHV